MRFWVGVSAAFGAGTLIGIGVGIFSVEDRLKKEYAEASASMRRAYEALKIDAETPMDLESDLIHIIPKGDGVALDQDVAEALVGPGPLIRKVEDTVIPDVVVKPTQTDNPYHNAVKATASNGDFASYSELSEEDYFDEDGRKKEQLTMIYSDDEPIFFHDGTEIDLSIAMDWVGSTIVDDMRAAVGKGEPILWVRNNGLETDYEVIFDQP